LRSLPERCGRKQGSIATSSTGEIAINNQAKILKLLMSQFLTYKLDEVQFPKTRIQDQFGFAKTYSKMNDRQRFDPHI
jgi:hypothetical protein